MLEIIIPSYLSYISYNFLKGIYKQRFVLLSTKDRRNNGEIAFICTNFRRNFCRFRKECIPLHAIMVIKVFCRLHKLSLPK